MKIEYTRLVPRNLTADLELLIISSNLISIIAIPLKLTKVGFCQQATQLK